MNSEVFAEWFLRRGHHIVRTASTYWYDAGARVYQALPGHWLICPPETELQELLKREGAVALRYSTSLATPVGYSSYHVVCGDKGYTLDALPKKARYDVRKGLGHVRIEPIGFGRLATEGWLLRSETLARQDRIGAETQRWWQRLCLSADGLPGFEAWGAVHDDQLVAALMAFTMDDCCSVLYQQGLTEHLRYGVNNALTYVFTREALGRSHVHSIFYGLHSLDAPASVDEFKFRMGYTAQPVRQRVVFHPWLAPLCNRASYRIVQGLAAHRSGNYRLAKAEGLIRFYLEGKLPLDQQSLAQPLMAPQAPMINWR